ncbi:MAG: hypothetical protein K2Q22_12505, partial [Cytophagales bacterium]|nr:hypothetical protein [Cytophagales bacterium]
MTRGRYFSMDTVSKPVLPAGSYIKKIIITYDNVPPQTTYFFNLTGFKILPIDRKGNPVIPSYPYLPQYPCDGVGTCIQFGSNVTYTYNSTSFYTSCYFGIMPKAKAPDINTIQKKITNPKFFVPGDTIDFELTFYNLGDSVVNGIITDTLTSSLKFVPNSWSCFSYYPIPNNFKPNFIQNGQVLRFEYFGDTNKIGIHFGLRYKAVIRKNVPPGVYYNTFFIKGDNIPYPLPPALYYYPEFFATTPFTVNDVTSVTADKGVKGILDDKFLFYPTNASTINGSDVDYKLRVRNLGNTKLVNTVLVDDLPFKNDSRGSQFTPYMTSLPSSNQPNVSIFYSLDSNVCVSEITPPITPVGCITPTWLNSAPSDLKTIKALKFFMSDSLAGGDSLIVTWKMSAPTNLNAGDVAYNKFDYQSNRASDNSPLLTTSPNKVGIVVSYLAQLGEYVWLDANQNGLQDESTAAGINGISVGLWKPGPDHVRNTSDDILFATTTTGLNTANEPGYYRFLVPPDDYFLKFSLDSCTYSPTTTITASNFVSSVFTLAPAQIKLDMNLGVVANTVSIPGTYNTCVGAGVIIPSTIVSGLSQWKYVWQKSTTSGVSWTNLSTATTASFTIPTVSASDSASYRLVMTKTGLPTCSITSHVLKLNVGSSSVSAPTVVPFVPTCATSGFQLLSASVTNLVWYTTSIGGIGSATAPLIDLSVPSTVTYFVGQGLGSCFTGRVPLPVEIKPKPSAPFPGNYAPLCKSSGFLALTASGSNLLWYLNTVSGVGSTLPIAINLATPQKFTFFVSQVSNQCESDLAPIYVEVVDPTMPGVSDQTYCVKNQTIILTATGSNLLWYTSSVGGIGVTTAPSIPLSSPATV